MNRALGCQTYKYNKQIFRDIITEYYKEAKSSFQNIYNQKRL